MSTASKNWLLIVGISIFFILANIACRESTPEELAQEAALDARNARIDFEVQREHLAKMIVKNQAKDPDSVDFIDVTSSDEAVCLTYTATNSFGGRVKGVAVLTGKGMSYKVKDFNKYC